MKESTGFAFLVCTSYVSLSLLLVFLNRQLFTEVFQWPIFITWFQQLIGTIIFWSLYFLSKTTYLSNFLTISTIPINWTTFLIQIPVVLSFVGMVLFANLALKFALISTYQTARCLTIFWTITFSKIFLNQRFNTYILAACCIQTSGFLIGSMDVTTLAPLGSLFGALSSISQGLYNVSVKKALQFTNRNAIQSIGFNLTMSNIILFPMIFMFGEAESFSKLPTGTIDNYFWQIWSLNITSGILATFMNYSTYLVINTTSPVTFNIIGVGKSSVQTLIGVLTGDPLTIRSLTGVILCILGSIWYGIIKINESNAKSQLSKVDSPNESDRLINKIDKFK